MFDLFGLGKKEEKSETAPKPAISLAAPSAAPQPQKLLTSEGREVTAVVEDLEKEVERIKDSMNVLKESLKGVNSKLEEIEKTLGQLASIYEIVMNQLNPFLDEDEKPLPARRQRPVQERREEVKEEKKVERPPVRAETAEVLLPTLELTNPKVIETVIDWVKFLVEKVGHNGIDELLQYYVDIRWISEEVKEILKRYADGIRVDIEPEVESVQLDPEDHAKSLEYILTIKDLMGR